MESNIKQSHLSSFKFLKSPVIQSIALMLLWAMSFTAAMSVAKTVSHNIHSLMLLFLRCFFGFVIFMPIVAKEGVKSIKTNRAPLHGLRVVFVCIAMFCTYYAYRHLPLATASAIGFTSPLFTAIFSFFFLGDRVTYKKWVAIFCGYLGVIIILRPLSFSFENAIYVALLANAFASGAIIVAKKLSSTESTITLMFYTNVFTFVLSAFSVPWVWQTPEMKDVFRLALIGLAGISSQFFYLKALKIANPSFLSPFEYTRLLFAIIVGALFFHEIPDTWSYIGILVIILATFSLSRLEIDSHYKGKA